MPGGLPGRKRPAVPACPAYREVMTDGESRAGVPLTNLDQPLFDGADATKRDLVEYLDAVAERIIPGLTGRPLSVVRIRPGQPPFMQKNLPKYTPEWVRSVQVWAETSKRNVSYALCDDRQTLLWFANQRAVEYHPALVRAGEHHVTHLVLDLDPPAGSAQFVQAVQAALLVRAALTNAGLSGAVKTSGAKGVHVFVPINPVSLEDSAAAARAIAAHAAAFDSGLATTAFIKDERHGKVFVDSTRTGGATVAAAYSPRIRPGCTVSYPVPWTELERVTPADFTIRSVPALVRDVDPWRAQLPEPQDVPPDLIAEGHAIPVARVQAMHEGKRRARQARSQASD